MADFAIKEAGVWRETPYVDARIISCRRYRPRAQFLNAAWTPAVLALAPETFGRAALVPFVPTRAIFRHRYRGLPAAIGPALWSVRDRGTMGEPTGPKTGIPFFLKTTQIVGKELILLIYMKN